MVERRSWIPMEDGVRLAASLYLPEAVEGGEAAPAVLEALPYRKDDATASYRPEYEWMYSEFGYAVARVDLRGTGSSEGVACCWPIHMGRVAQVGVTTSAVGAPYATCSSFPVEVGSVVVSPAIEASLR